MRLPLSAVRLLTRGVIGPLLSPRLPLAVRRTGLDALGAAVPLPRGARTAGGVLGGVPTTAFAARGAGGPLRLLYLHGGAYQLGSPRSHRALLAGLSAATGSITLALDYRLAPEHPHPAAVEDALAAWHALRAAGHEARHIMVAGDSAGGGLALSLVLRLRAAGEELPGSVGLISPWVDLDCSSPVMWRNADTDAMLDPGWLPDAAAAYRGDPTATDLRPLEADLAGLPPLHVVAGGSEVLVDDADRLVARAREAGTPVTYLRAPRMWHAYPVSAGYLREADDAVAALGAALRADCTVAAPA